MASMRVVHMLAGSLVAFSAASIEPIDIQAAENAAGWYALGTKASMPALSRHRGPISST
jgi:hypothetical protein